MKQKDSILLRAHKIIHERAEEKARQYGPLDESMINAAKIASLMTRQEVTPEMGFAFMIALKLARESYGHKEDNLLDAVAYISALNDFKTNTTAVKQTRNRAANNKDKAARERP